MSSPDCDEPTLKLFQDWHSQRVPRIHHSWRFALDTFEDSEKFHPEQIYFVSWSELFEELSYFPGRQIF